MSEYQLTQAEQKYIERLRQLQTDATNTARPQVLTVLVTNTTLSFWDGKPTGTAKDEGKNGGN